MFKKVLRYETARLKNNRTMLIILGVSVILVILAIALIYWLAPTEELQTTENREQSIYFNEMWYQEYKAALDNPDLSLSEKAYLMREAQRYKFFSEPPNK